MPLILLLLTMTETNSTKPMTGPISQRGKESGDKNGKRMCKDTTRQDAVSEATEGKDQSTARLSIEKENPTSTSTHTAEPVAPIAPISAQLFSIHLSGLYYRTLALILAFAFWRSRSYSASIWTVSSSNLFNNSNDQPLSHFRCYPSFCYNVSLSFHKSEGLLPASSPRKTVWVPPVLKTCTKDGNKFFWSKQPNGRRYELMCSDTFIQGSTDINGDGVGAAGACLGKCISDNSDCEGVLYLPDRPFERNCFFQHNNERPAFEAGERVLGARLMKD